MKPYDVAQKREPSRQEEKGNLEQNRAVAKVRGGGNRLVKEISIFRESQREYNQERREKHRGKHIGPSETILGIFRYKWINWWWRFALAPLVGILGIVFAVDGVIGVVVGQSRIGVLVAGVVMIVAGIVLWPSKESTRKNKEVIVTDSRLILSNTFSKEAESIPLNSISNMSPTSSGGIDIRMHSAELIEISPVKRPEKLTQAIGEAMSGQPAVARM